MYTKLTKKVRPKKDLGELFGAWKWLSAAELKEMRKVWGRFRT